MIKYSATITTGANTWTVSECDSREEARRRVFLFATNGGWTPPRWWQFHRWGESWWKWSRDVREALTASSGRSAQDLDSVAEKISPDPG